MNGIMLSLVRNIPYELSLYLPHLTIIINSLHCFYKMVKNTVTFVSLLS